MHSPNSQKSPKIGIIADSHGHPACLQDALDLFEQHGCERIYHLGDICDSAHPETAETCVKLLQQHRVHAIKGNNDHQVVVNHMDSPPAYISVASIEFLKNLPLTREIDDLILTHSLPFIKQRGLSSMVGNLGEHEIGLFLRLYPNKILMRGHSHRPELIQARNQAIVNEGLTPGETRPLSDILPGIITCGAVDHGILNSEAMIIAIGRVRNSTFLVHYSSFLLCY
jgi:putative phosphoesterase